MFIDRFTDPAPDPRTDPPTTGDERTMLISFLRFHRDTLELKCSGLDAVALARRSAEPSTMSLLGLVRHLAEVERIWFRIVLTAHDVPALYFTPEDPDAEFHGAAPEPELVAQAWDAWRAEVAFADRFLAEAPDLDITGQHHSRGTVSLRWVLVHLIEEYARHNGHLDLLRQRIDGAVGQ